MFDRFLSGPAATVVGALLLIAGGIAVVAHAQGVGTILAVAGCVLVVRARLKQRSSNDAG